MDLPVRSHDFDSDLQPNLEVRWSLTKATMKERKRLRPSHLCQAGGYHFGISNSEDLLREDSEGLQDKAETHAKKTVTG